MVLVVNGRVGFVDEGNTFGRPQTWPKSAEACNVFDGHRIVGLLAFCALPAMKYIIIMIILCTLYHAAPLDREALQNSPRWITKQSGQQLLTCVTSTEEMLKDYLQWTEWNDAFRTRDGWVRSKTKALMMSGAWPPPAPSVWYVWIVRPQPKASSGPNSLFGGILWRIQSQIILWKLLKEEQSILLLLDNA